MHHSALPYRRTRTKSSGLLTCLALLLMPVMLRCAPIPVKEVAAAELSYLGRVIPLSLGRAAVTDHVVERIDVDSGVVTGAFHNRTDLTQEATFRLMLINNYGMRLTTITTTAKPSSRLAPGKSTTGEGKFMIPNLDAIFRPSGVELPPDWRQIRYAVIYDVEAEQAREREDRKRVAQSVNSYDQPPVVRLRTRPTYPRELRSAGVGGEVIIDFIVTTHGDVGEAKVVSSTEPGLNEAALACISQWKFKPAMKDGKPVESRMKIPLVFSIN